MGSKSSRKPSKAALDARKALERLSPDAAKSLGDHFTVADVQEATLNALSKASASSQGLVALNTRIPAELKTAITDCAHERGIKLQELIADALKAYLSINR